ncbi:MAG: serine hydrolase [Chitinophagaceae bacterium]|nr:serine hydrolase [Chitinophagaceae bacterium]
MKKILFIIFIPITISAQKNYPLQLDKYVEAQHTVKGFSGTVLVMKQNKVMLKKAYGLADREWNIANTTDTKYRIGSITKQFTAASILQLVEQGKLNLDDRLNKFIPDFPKGDSVTIHMLLNHTSGIASFTDMKDFGNVDKLTWSKDSMITFFKNRPYNFSPGTKFQYNNSGYFLLGYILEKVSGQSYNDYLHENIFNKLGMTNTGIDILDSVLPLRARGYSKINNKYVNAEFISLAWPFSAGVLYSTADDLYKWDRALYGTTILSAPSKQKMFTPGKNNYGYGIVIDSLEKHFRTWHNGGIPGFVSNISRYINDDVCIIVLSNDDFNADGVADGLAGILFDAPVEYPYLHKEIKIDPSLLDNFVGKYKAFLTLEVIKKDGKLYRHRDGTPDIELKPESETKFFYADDSDRQLEFEVDKAGKVTKIWFENNEQRGEMQRIQ